ncbi:MAG: C10 family peptidase [Bacteroidales bacterium]|nr:C10 family peptidase [Bacteroidales bacterium]
MIHTRFYLLLLTLAACCVLTTHAQHRSLDQARAEAWHFLRHSEPNAKRKLLARRPDHLHVLRTANNTQAAHVLASSTTQGAARFVVVAADEQLPTILGYGNGISLSDSLPEGLQLLLQEYDKQWQLAQLHPSTTMRTQRPQPTAPIAPFLGIVRHQASPFNGACPYYIHSNGDTSSVRTLVGCVATSMEQVLSYYGRSITLRDSLPARTTPHYHVPALPAGTTLHFDRTLADYRNGYAQADSAAVAEASVALGLVAGMHWGVHESGSNFTNPITPLRHTLGLGYVHYLDSYRYTPEIWWQILYNELAHQRPIMYAGSLMTMGAHAFVIDGVDTEGRVHVHWGFGGQCNGYFRLWVLNPFSERSATASDDYFGLFANHQAILLHPDAQPPLPDTLVRTGKEIVVDSLVIHRPATNQGYTPATLYVHNDAAITLTTPLAIFTNAPSDTAALRQARPAALTSCTLTAGEVRALPVWLKLTTTGTQQLRVTPEENIIFDQSINIAEAPPIKLDYTLRLLHTTDSTLTALATFDNTGSSHPSGIRVTYALFEGDTREPDSDVRHFAALDIPAGQVLTDTIHFAHLTPNTRYYLALREPWQIRAELTATTQASPITHLHPTTYPTLPAQPRYDLHGRPLSPQMHYHWRKGTVAMPK